MKRITILLVAVVVCSCFAEDAFGIVRRRSSSSSCGSSGCALPDVSQTNEASITEATRSPGLSIPTKDIAYKTKVVPAPAIRSTPHYDAAIVAEMLHRSGAIKRAFASK